MNNKELEQMFDNKFNIHYLRIFREDYEIISDVKEFMFDTIIPEILKSVIPDLKDTQTNDEWINMMRYWNNDCIYEIKQKAKELYWIDL